MERVRWTDERIDERMAAIDNTFDRVFTELHTLREEMHAGFAQLRAEMAADRAEVVVFHRQVTLIVAGQVVALIGLLGAFVAAQL